ncbi:MAG: ABC transporter ATP-binding protein [Erysipelotrichaceae bacterium]|nr:ABC transporter ATP-binding protein [Erysipelotrichaceae bacterium]
MKEIKNICSSILCVIKIKPTYLVVKILTIITSVISSLIPVFVVNEIVNIYYEDKNIGRIAILIGICFIILAFIKLCDFIIELYDAHVRRIFVAEESIIFYKKLSSLDYELHESPIFLNDYTRALEESVDHIFSTCNGTFNVLKIVITSIGMFSIIATMHYSVIIVAVGLAIIYTILKVLMAKVQFKASTQQRPFRRMTRYNERSFTLKESMSELKTTEIGDLLLEKNEIAHNNIIKVFDKYIFPKTILSFICNLLLTLLYPLIICVVAYFTIDNLTEEAVAWFASMTVAATTLSTLITQLARAFGEVGQSMVEVSVAFDLLKMEGTIESKKGIDVNEFNSLDVENISFSYKGDVNQLENISMHIKKGQKIAIVGHNGAGKTTLVKLLLRLYDVKNGAILYNNTNYKDINVNSLRKEVGAVFQNVEVYAVSIAENVLLRTPKSEEDFDLINKALKFSGLDEYVEKLPNGINTIVTKEFDKDGVVLSGGNNQRLAIARGYALNYNLFILDEPSSALDPLAEAKVYNNMLALGRDKTIIFISHRLTTTVNADYIYLFEHGKIIEQGTHLELMKLDGKYKEMFTSQSKKYLGGDYDEK